jgi:hypothetical protein
MNHRIYIADLLRARIKQQGLNPSQEQIKDLFTDLYQAWAKLQTRSPNPREATIWLFNALDRFLDLEATMQKSGE